jgi:hypothetical protein
MPASIGTNWRKEVSVELAKSRYLPDLVSVCQPGHREVSWSRRL